MQEKDCIVLYNVLDYIVMINKKQKENKMKYIELIHNKKINALVEYLNNNCDNNHYYSYAIENGRKYDKIVREYNFYSNYSGKCVYCFIEKETGNIYKPASWRGPYKKGAHAIRGNVYEVESYKNADPYGTWLYL